MTPAKSQMSHRQEASMTRQETTLSAAKNSSWTVCPNTTPLKAHTRLLIPSHQLTVLVSPAPEALMYPTGRHYHHHPIRNMDGLTCYGTGVGHQAPNPWCHFAAEYLCSHLTVWGCHPPPQGHWEGEQDPKPQGLTHLRGLSSTTPETTAPQSNIKAIL